MSDLFWTGDHSKTAVERLRLAEDLAIDVRIDSNIYNALNLARFHKNATHTQFVVVPAQLLFLAAGGAFHLYQEVPKPWGVVTSLPSIDTLEHTLKNAYDKGFGLDDDEEVVTYKSAWAMRQAITEFAVKHVDLPDGNDNFALIVDEDDRQQITQTNARRFTNPHLLYLNNLTMGQIVAKGSLASWTLLLWLLQITYSAPAEGDDSDLCIVARALQKAALECFPHLDHALPAAISSFLQLASTLPSELLTEDCNLADRLQFIKFVVDYSKPANHLSLIRKNFAVILVHHPDLSKWVGDGSEAYANFCELRRLLVPNVEDSFDMLELLARQLRKYDMLYVEGKIAQNILMLTEMLQTDRGYSLKSDQSSSSRVEGEAVASDALTSSLSTFLARLTKWKANLDDDGKPLKGEPDPLDLMEICVTAEFTPVRMWALGQSKLSGLPASVFNGTLVGMPLLFNNFFLDIVSTASDGEVEAGLRDLTAEHYSAEFLRNLKAGRLDQINWDKDFLVPMLQLISTETVKPLSLEQLLRDSDRFAFFKELVPKALWAIGLTPDADHSLPSVLKHIEAPLRLARTAGDAMHRDVASAAAAYLRGAMQHATLRLQTAFKGKVESSTSFVDDTLRARVVFDERVSNLHDMSRLMRNFQNTVATFSPAKTPRGGKASGGKRRLADLGVDEQEAPGSRHDQIVERGGDGDFFSFSAAGGVYSRKAIQAGLVEKGNKDGCEIYAVAKGQPHLKERWCLCGKDSWKHKVALSAADQVKFAVRVDEDKLANEPGASGAGQHKAGKRQKQKGFRRRSAGARQ